MTDLLPCPFCGAAARVAPWKSQTTGRAWFRVYCDADNPPGCPAEPFIDADTEAEAIAAWNKRAGQDEVVEMCAKVADSNIDEGQSMDRWDRGFRSSAQDIAKRIRALKHEASDEGKARDHGDGKAE